MLDPEFHATSTQAIFTAEIRNANSLLWVAFGIFASFLLIACAKLYKADVFANLRLVVFRNRNLIQLIRENFNFGHIGNYILLVNFWLQCSMCLFFTFDYFSQRSLLPMVPFWQITLLPCLFFAWQVVGLYGVTALTGAKNIRQENGYNFILIPQFFGLLFFPISLIWYLHPDISYCLLPIFLCFLAILILFILIRGIIFSWQQGMPLYYIILYICTLEILPLVVLLTRLGVKM